MTAKASSLDATSTAFRKVEQRGVEYIPESDRTSSPRNLVWVFFGADLTLGVIVIGWLAVVFGLNWWSAFTALTIGTLVGSLVFAPMLRFGKRTGTNGAVSSGAHFGVVGRLIGSIVGLLSALGFYALTVWTSGEGLIAGGAKLLGMGTSNVALGIGYAVIALATFAIAVYGHGTVLAVQKVLVPAVGLIMIVTAIVVAGDFESTRESEYILGSFWPTWVLAAVTAASSPIGWGPMGNDYGRYIPSNVSDRAVTISAGVGMFLGCWVSVIFGAFVALCFPADAASFVQGLVGAAPTWFMPVIIILALISSCGQCAAALYGTGLDLGSIFPKLTRVQATMTISAVGAALVFLGTFVWEAIDTVSAFLIILTVMATPWIIINLVGFAHRRGRYSPHDLQTFNSGERGGLYWFTGGWNLRAVAAWVPAIVVGSLFTNTSLFTGPWSSAANGVDLSFASSALVGGVLFYVLLRLFPEDRDVRSGVPTATEGPAALEPTPVLAGETA
jgi:purine-cytosine permease-like protein